MVHRTMNQCKPSELKDFALRVLYGTTLEDKLAPPSETVLQGTSTPFPVEAFVTPGLPGRPKGLELSKHPKKRQIHLFPSKAALGLERSRGHVLHFFANHELLALEIMALAILKFSEAPVGFIRGIIQTMADEQRHMHQYIKRMTELGVTFGDAPLNGFFWQSLKDMKDPREYAAAMSLTFEQANLDFSLFFEQDFLRLGDNQTALILNEVRRDEIGHVKHGAIWLDRWRDPAKSLWDEYISLLRFPMTPARGKGPMFDREGRRLAGLTDDFINQVEVFSHSRGRPPRVFWFNPICEQEVGLQSRITQQPKQFRELTEDLAPLMMHLGHSDDVVIVAKELSLSWRKTMKLAGFEIPEFVLGANDLMRNFGDRHLGGLDPWGWSPCATEMLRPLQKNLVSGRPKPPFDSWKTDANGDNIFSKSHAVALRTEHDLKGFLCKTIADIDDLLTENLSAQSYKRAVIKAPIGSSGHNAIQVDTGLALDPKFQSWCHKILKAQHHVVVEPWVERIADVSCQLEISANGEIKIIGFTRFFVNSFGTYKGHIFGKLLGGLAPELHVQWHQADTGWAARFEQSAKKCGSFLWEHGYHGPAGIDGFLYRTPEGTTRFQSLGEINPRFTMGRVALELSRHLISKQPGMWLHVSKKELSESGFATFADLAANLASKHPIKMRHHPSGSLQIEEGALCTNDPDSAQQMLTVLCTGGSVEEFPLWVQSTS